MSDDPPKKIAMFLPVSTETLLPPWITESLWAGIFGPDIRTPEQREADRLAREAESARVRAEVTAEHEARLAASDGLRRAVLELHAPHFTEWGTYPTCEGCDAEGYEVESPQFPCRTYDLAAESVGGTETR